MAPPSSRQRSTIAVIGLGNIGGVATGCLRAADRHDVIACVRQPINRLHLERPEGNVEVPLRALTEPADARPVDWVLLCTKAQQTSSSAPWLARLCDSSTRVAVLQNGISHVARVAPLAGDAKVVPVLVYYNGERLAADRVRLRHVAEHDLVAADDADGRAFAQLLEGTPLRVLLSREFSTLAGRKLLINTVANPITALTLHGQPRFRRAYSQALCISVLEEAVAVGAAEGVPFAGDEARPTMSSLLTYPPGGGTPRYFDRSARRGVGGAALTGAVVETGRRLGT